MSIRTLPPEYVRLSDLPLADKRRLWAWMQANDPATVESLTSPVHADLVAAFGGGPVMEREYVRRALTAEVA